jgi:hypothetical protein
LLWFDFLIAGGSRSLGSSLAVTHAGSSLQAAIVWGDEIMLKLTQIQTLVAMVALITGTPAFAKKNRRDGFNFGTGVKIINSDDRTLAGETSDKSVHMTKETQAFSPYAAISNGTFNLGLKADLDSTSVSETEVSTTSSDESLRNRQVTTNSGSIFCRFLFGEILYLEGGLGIYQEKQVINNVYTSGSSDGAFLGAKEQYKIEGTGPGYHIGGGFEIATGAGFFFNGAYLAKIYQINEGDAIFGKSGKRAYEQKREVSFGLGYYYN